MRIEFLWCTNFRGFHGIPFFHENKSRFSYQLHPTRNQIQCIDHNIKIYVLLLFSEIMRLVTRVYVILSATSNSKLQLWSRHTGRDCRVGTWLTAYPCMFSLHTANSFARVQQFIPQS